MLAKDAHASLPIRQGCLSQAISTGGRKSTVLPRDEREMPSRSLLSSQDDHKLTECPFSSREDLVPIFLISIFKATSAWFGSTSW